MTVHSSHNDNSLDPGPIDNSVLKLQHKHRSGAIWEGQDPGVLTCRQRLATMMRQWPLDERLHPYINQAGFYGVYRVGFIQLDWALITALVERWREETHTFHFAVGEATVTLQDVAVLLGLRVNGNPVTGSGDGQWGDLSEELLGLKPDGGALQGSALKISWLRDNFLQPPPHADDVTLKCYARAYILALMGGSLFADKSGSDVHLIFLPLLRDFEVIGQLSWGSATLAHLYRELCRASRTGAIEIAGPLILLQLWAWERLHIGRPDRLRTRGPDLVALESESLQDGAAAVGEDVTNGARASEEPLRADPLGCRWRVPFTRKGNPFGVLTFYRDQLDQQRDDQMIWQPYTSETLPLLPNICVADQHVWQAVVPLICFDIVEWHRPNRVLRQFGLRQGIPEHCDNSVALHAIDRRGRHHFDWREYHAEYIKLWGEREHHIVIGEPQDVSMHYFDPYMEWYRKVTRRFITPFNRRSSGMRFQPNGGATHLLVHSLTTIYERCTATVGSTSESAMQALTDIQNICTKVLHAINEGYAITPATLMTPTSVIQTLPPELEMASESPPLLSNLAHLTYEEVSQAPESKTPTIKGRGSGRGRGRGAGCGRGRGRGRRRASPGTLSPIEAQEIVISSMPSEAQPSVPREVVVETTEASETVISSTPLSAQPSFPHEPPVETTEPVIFSAMAVAPPPSVVIPSTPQPPSPPLLPVETTEASELGISSLLPHQLPVEAVEVVSRSLPLLPMRPEQQLPSLPSSPLQAEVPGIVLSPTSTALSSVALPILPPSAMAVPSTPLHANPMAVPLKATREAATQTPTRWKGRGRGRGRGRKIGAARSTVMEAASANFDSREGSEHGSRSKRMKSEKVVI